MMLIFFSCIKTEVEGIKIGHDLYENFGYKENKALVTLIQGTIKKDERSLYKLIGYWCGGAAGCYDLGDVIVQIIFKIGEDDFMEMASKLPARQQHELKNLIEVGLEYGNFDYLKEIKTPTIEKIFPKLNELLGN
ncbi:MAG: hypothetical protein IT258_09635 [Saprospiraceae bacterium]|nr:hypothetical protein [Saprospiraceae bacterium]